MDNKLKTKNDEIDLGLLFMKLWDNKLTLVIFLIISILGSGIFIFIKKPIYEARLNYEVDLVPPFYEHERAYLDFEKLFFSAKYFSEWKKKNNKSVINFNDLSKTKTRNGFLITKDRKKLLADFKKTKIDYFILIRSNKLSKLNDIYNYSNYINFVLKSKYLIRAENELLMLKKSLSESNNNFIINEILAIDRFIDLMKRENEKIIIIQRPTNPLKTSPKTNLIMLTSILLGGIVGVFFIFIRSSLYNSKKIKL